MTPSERHNAAVKPVLREITRRIGPDPKALLVFAATLVTGIFMVIVRLGGDEPVLEVFMEDVKDRLANARLGSLEPKGEA